MRNKRYLVLTVLIVFLVFSCDKIKYKNSYYDNGILKEREGYLKNELKEKFKYDSIGNVFSKTYYSNNGLDSLIAFDKKQNLKFKKSFFNDSIYYVAFKNNSIMKRGFLKNDSLKVGWWEYFDDVGVLKSKREYKILCEDYVLNQSIIFNQKGDTIFRDDDYNESTFYDFKVVDLNNGKLKVDYKVVPISNRSILQLGIINKDEFCKIQSKNIDTAINLKSNRGTLVLNKNKFNKGLIVDYRSTKKGVELKEGVSTLSRKMYFDLDDYIVE
jgi:hypothetical protein